MCRANIDFTPKVIRQIHNNGFGGAAYNNPQEGDLAGRINLLVRKPRRDIKKIACLRRRVKLPLLAAANI